MVGVALFAIIAIVVFAAVFVPLALTGGHSSSQTPTTATANPAVRQADTLYQEALAAANAAAGYHYVASSTAAGATQTIVGDAGQKGGSQVLTLGTEQFSLRLVDDIVYFEGNTPALEDQLGVAAASAPGLDGTWISVSPGDGPYTQLEEGITVASSIQEVVLDPTSTSPVMTSSGAATRISGTVSGDAGAGTGHLDVSPSSHLPIDYATSSSGVGVTETDTTAFSDWGTAPSVTVPAGATAWAGLGASEPSGGYGSGLFPSAGASPAATPTPSSTSSSA
jgi:hypothetical protein